MSIITSKLSGRMLPVGFADVSPEKGITVLILDDVAYRAVDYMGGREGIQTGELIFEKMQR